MTLDVSSNIFSSFQKIKDDALSHLAEIQARKKTSIMVGTATCGRAAGALEVLQAIREELDKKDHDAFLLESGCMGHCYAEPIVIIGKPGLPPIIYGYVTPEIARRLVQDYVLGDDFSLEFALGAWEKNDLIPPITDMPRFVYEKLILLENCGRLRTSRRPFYVPWKFPLDLLELNAADLHGSIVLPVAAADLVLVRGLKFEDRDFRMAPLRNNLAHDFGLRGLRPCQKILFVGAHGKYVTKRDVSAHLARQAFDLHRVPRCNPVLLCSTSNDGVHRPSTCKSETFIIRMVIVGVNAQLALCRTSFKMSPFLPR